MSGIRTTFFKSLIDLSDKYKIELIYYPPYHFKHTYPIERIWKRLNNW